MVKNLIVTIIIILILIAITMQCLLPPPYCPALVSTRLLGLIIPHLHHMNFPLSTLHGQNGSGNTQVADVTTEHSGLLFPLPSKLSTIPFFYQASSIPFPLLNFPSLI